MANVTITQLPTAQTLTGLESVPVVQNGVTVQTTTGAIANSPVLTQTFLTVGAQPQLGNSRYLTAGPGLATTDGGAAGPFSINLTGAPLALNTSPLGFQAKVATNTLAGRSFQAGNGLAITNPDGIAGDPVFTLTGIAAAIAAASGTGMLAIVGGTAIANRSIVGVANQITVVDGNGAGNPTIGLASNPIVPGTGAITVPVGTVAQRSGGLGAIRYDTDLGAFEGFTSAGWGTIVAGAAVSIVNTGTGLTGGPITTIGTISLADTAVTSGVYTNANITVNAQGQITAAANGAAGGVTSFSGDLTGLTPNYAATGDVVLGGALNVNHGGTGATTLTGYIRGNGSSPFTASAAIPTTDLSGTITNVQLANSAVTINGTSVSLGASATIPIVTNNPLTIGTGLTGTSFNGSAPVTVAIDSTVATLTSTQVLTNKSVSGATNTLSNIGNAALINSAVTINGSAVSLGGSTTITAVSPNALTLGTGLTGTSYNGSGAVTAAIDSTVVTLAGTQVLTNKTLTAPTIKNNFKFEAAGIGAYTQFAGTIGSWISNTNGFQVVYAENQNNGSDASADWVAYNDASDGSSYFIDMGINSSGYTSVTYPIFTPNSAYIFTGGGTTGQQTDFYLGTSNANSDVIFFTGDVQLANIRGAIHGDTGNWTIGSSLTDTGEKFQIAGTAKISGAVSFGSTVLLNADPTLALQAATKQYVDSAVATGFTVHPSVNLATTAALPTNTYANGTLGVGATLTAVATGILTIDGVLATAGMRVLIKNEAASSHNGTYTVTVAGAVGVAYILTRATDFDQAAAGEIANNAYFFITAGSSLTSSSFVLSQTATIVVGTTALPFTLFASAVAYTGGTNINVAGQVISLTGTVAATNGGTGTATVATGDLLYGSATNTWSKLALGGAYSSLQVNAAGTQLQWNAVALNQATAVSGQLGVGNGGTGASTLTGYVIGNGIGAMTASATIPSTAIMGLATSATTDTTNAANIASGTLPSARLTGSYTGISGVGTLTAGTWNANTVGVAYGGTGAITLTGYVKGSGTSALTASATIPNTDVSGLGTMSTQAANAITITGGTINGATIGATSATTGKFTTVTATSGISGGTF